MTRKTLPSRAAIPSVDQLLRAPACADMIDLHGRVAVTNALRAVLAEHRQQIGDGQTNDPVDPSRAALTDSLLARAGAQLAAQARVSLRPVINLTGTVLHTNLGRAWLPDEAVAAMVGAAGAANLEFDVGRGRRGDRDDHIEGLICELTGAEAATVVNNNAAAVLLTLNSLANRREVPVSRGELIEIGGSFRIPDIMKRAGAKLVEVGTTNRTHLKDFAEAMSERSALIMKVHTSNYVVQGFTAAVAEPDLAQLAHDYDRPFIVDLGSGTLADFAALGLPPEPTPASTLAGGADLVTFSGDKLLGGPQAGLIVGRADLIKTIKRNPMKRALRLDKVTIAGLEAVLRLYRDPDRLAERVPTLRLLTKPVAVINDIAVALAPTVQQSIAPAWRVEVVDCHSEIGSGALPTETLASKGLRIVAVDPKKTRGKAVERLAAQFRGLPVPVIGRVHDGALLFDLRCLEDVDGFAAQLAQLKTPGAP